MVVIHSTPGSQYPRRLQELAAATPRCMPCAALARRCSSPTSHAAHRRLEAYRPIAGDAGLSCLAGEWHRSLALRAASLLPCSSAAVTRALAPLPHPECVGQQHTPKAGKLQDVVPGFGAWHRARATSLDVAVSPSSTRCRAGRGAARIRACRCRGRRRGRRGRGARGRHRRIVDAHAVGAYFVATHAEYGVAIVWHALARIRAAWGADKVRRTRNFETGRLTLTCQFADTHRRSHAISVRRCAFRCA
jgi:hypothetical protein